MGPHALNNPKVIICTGKLAPIGLIFNEVGVINTALMRIRRRDTLSTAILLILIARGAMAARQVLTLKIEVRVLAGEFFYQKIIFLIE